jgi:hypothetical protein
MRPGRYQSLLEHDSATGCAVVLRVGPEIEHALPHQHEPFDHPIERAAVEHLVAPARRLQGAVAELRSLSLPRQPLQPLGLPLGELLHRIDADTKLDEMDGHFRSMRHE